MNKLMHKASRKLRYAYLRKVVAMNGKITKQMNIMNKKIPITELDRIAQDAVRRSIWDKGSTLLRVENTRYVKIPHKKIYIVLEDQYALVANSVYSYRFHINEAIYKQLCDNFDSTAKKRALAIDTEIYNNIKANIRSILTEI